MDPARPFPPPDFSALPPPAPVTPTPIPAPIPPPTDPEPTGKQKKRKGKNTTASASPAGPKRSGWSGKRAGILIARIVVIGFFVFFFVVGFISFAIPRPVPTVADIAGPVGELLGRNGYPIEAGQSLALRFTNAYLNYTPDTAEGRLNALTGYAPTLDPAVLEVGGINRQTVIAGPYLAAAPTLFSPNEAVFLVLAAVQTPTKASWVTLAVPITADENGQVAVTQPPSFQPNQATPAIPPPPVTSDADFEAELTDTRLIEYFMADWAASNETRLRTLIADDATPIVTQGMNKTLVFRALSELIVPVDPANPPVRIVYATVNWVTDGGAEYTQAYTLTLSYSPAGEWRVQDIQPR